MRCVPPHNCFNCELLVDAGELLYEHVEHSHVAAVIVLGHLEEVSHPQSSRVIRKWTLCDLKDKWIFSDPFLFPSFPQFNRLLPPTQRTSGYCRGLKRAQLEVHRDKRRIGGWPENICTESPCYEESKCTDLFSSSAKDLCNQRSCMERKLTPAGKITFNEPDFWLALICAQEMSLIENMRDRKHKR